MVRTFLVECYLPGVDESAVAEASRRVRVAIAAAGDLANAVRYTGATLVPADEVVFHAFTAPDASSVEHLSRAAGLPFERIVEAMGVDVGPGRNTIGVPRTAPTTRGGVE